LKAADNHVVAGVAAGGVPVEAPLAAIVDFATARPRASGVSSITARRCGRLALLCDWIK
jgi:hypothetical protein